MKRICCCGSWHPFVCSSYAQDQLEIPDLKIGSCIGSGSDTIREPVNWSSLRLPMMLLWFLLPRLFAGGQPMPTVATTLYNLKCANPAYRQWCGDNRQDPSEYKYRPGVYVHGLLPMASGTILLHPDRIAWQDGLNIHKKTPINWK